MVLCVDEKSQIQALDRTQPTLPLRRGRHARMTHDYKRNGTATLFAALEVATGKVVDACYDRHRHQEFLKFLRQVAKAYPRVKLHVVCDNYGTHKHPKVNAWLAKTPGSRCTSHRVRQLAQPRRGVLFDHHPPGDPPRQRPLRTRPHHSDQDVHRRLERTLPTLRVDQNRRRSPRQS